MLTSLYTPGYDAQLDYVSSDSTIVRATTDTTVPQVRGFLRTTDLYAPWQVDLHKRKLGLSHDRYHDVKFVRGYSCRDEYSTHPHF